MFLKPKPRIPCALADFAQTGQLREERHQEAEQDYLTGLAKLQSAEAQGYQDKTSVLAAYRHLATAIAKNRSEVRYQTAMAYLLLLIGNQTRAMQHVAEALRLEPGNERALLLQTQLLQIRAASPNRLRLAAWQALEDAPVPRSDTEFDQAYEELEAFIAQEVRLMMQSQVSPEATLDVEQAQEQARFHEQLLALEALLSDKIAQLENEIETQPLTRMLMPLQMLSSRIEQALELHTLFHLLLDGIEGTIEEVASFHQVLDAGENIAEAEVEAILDLCDELADQLDDLEQYSGLQAVLTRYRALLREVEKLQDRIEGF